MREYVPIACARHEALELAILKRRRLRIALSDAGGGGVLVALPVDIRIADAAEWLLVRAADGGERRLRLDWILSAEPADGVGPAGGGP
ncbi:transcriptional antiterminator, Rof [uncultured Thiohalocapsa sp.]|uniref:Rho-binding antiterminator n=1 Tax=uncultured Thiohalocapsa sp. TaxID=768990 RepID=UPI0025E9E318|nr:transcriptional antiterminator, Rof [uncultured Thiohalocapsa sp.]